MIQINLAVGSHYALDRKALRETARRILASKNIEHAQLDVSVVGKRKIRTLNESQLQHDGTTDVLSFPQHERHQLNDVPLPKEIPPHLGDIVICYPVAIEQAKRYGKMVDHQLSFLLEHGIMHLLGYHHD